MASIFLKKSCLRILSAGEFCTFDAFVIDSRCQMHLIINGMEAKLVFRPVFFVPSTHADWKN